MGPVLGGNAVRRGCQLVLQGGQLGLELCHALRTSLDPGSFDLFDQLGDLKLHADGVVLQTRIIHEVVVPDRGAEEHPAGAIVTIPARPRTVRVMDELDEEAAAARAAIPGARRPDRHWRIPGFGVELAIWEWGDDRAPTLLLVHGGFDFAGTLDRFAPLLADAGWRVVSWDMRGHGDSDHAHLYTWDADVRDAMAVFDAVAREPVHVVGHSKGGNMMVTLADAQPHRFAKLVNLDGMPSGANAPDVAERDRTKLLSGELASWLDHRRGLAGKQRRPDTLDGLARRRAKMNPRLPIEWLRYLVTVGARKDPDGWRWKIDPSLRLGGFGPRRPEWGMVALAGLGMPFLGVLATMAEDLGWSTTPDDVGPYLPRQGELVQLEDTGHFVHIERPETVAELVLDFLAR